MMKPILFNTEMVRAILDGRKTVTRRVVKPQPTEHLTCGPNWKELLTAAAAPYRPGDVLWVRETWADYDRYYYKATEPDAAEPIENSDPRWFKWHPSIHMPKEAARLFLRVTDVRVERLQDITTVEICKEGVWVEPPPIVKGVSSPDDFEKRTDSEREEWIQSAARATYIGQCDHIAALHRAWESLWDTTIKPADLHSYGWDANPWVWVIEPERCEKPGEE